jgi:serine/threonine-protein kinase
VYAAEHTLLGRPAAIKVLLPELSRNQDMVHRFFNEARAATAIRHPGIVEIYDFGWMPDGAAYIVMELLEGEPLSKRHQRGRLRWQAAIGIARQIAGALAAAHAKGIVHRDLKPDNVFLVRDAEVPGGERIKLLDFGIAKLDRLAPSGPRSGGAALTVDGAVIGTPSYMAPEQCRGVAVDHRVDLYSLGCVVFELCSGRPPFVGEGTGDVLAAHIHLAPPTLSAVGVEAPYAVEQLVQRLLAKLPAARVQTADALIRAIDAISVEPPAAAAVSSGGIRIVTAAPSNTTLSGASVTLRTPRTRREVRKVAVVASAAAAVTVVVVAAVMLRGHEPPVVGAAGDHVAASLAPGPPVAKPDPVAVPVPKAPAARPPDTGSGAPAIAVRTPDTHDVPAAGSGVTARKAAPPSDKPPVSPPAAGSASVSSSAGIAAAPSPDRTSPPVPSVPAGKPTEPPTEPPIEPARPRAGTAPAPVPAATKPAGAAPSAPAVTKPAGSPPAVPALVDVHIDSTPSGASVLFKGKEIGTTAFNGTLRRGPDASLTLHLDGYADRTIVVHTDQAVHTSVKLERSRSRPLPHDRNESVNPFGQ